MDNIDPKILKIVALAKQGIGGEKETAIALVKRICEREGIDFDELMSSKDAPKEYFADIKAQSKDELRIAIQVAARFATTKQEPHVRGKYFSFDRSIRLWYVTTPSKHIDTLNAISIYLTAYRKEKKKFLKSLNLAFYSHHNLYPQFDSEDDDDDNHQMTVEEKQDAWRAAHMQMAMTESVNLIKQIGDGKHV